MKAALLTIGTEVTDGEIVNTNASWLAAELSRFGVQVTHHLSTPDDPKLMLGGLQWLEDQVDWIFITGGLGPTTDDKTREVVSEWLGVACEFSEKEWKRLQKLYIERSLEIRSSHKHQCFFPAGAEPLDNPVGTALGFRCEKQNAKGSLRVAVLPGPPRELRGVFEAGIVPTLELLNLDAPVLKTWTLFGITESDAADRAEKFFASENVELGYRASIPYVHVKVWFPCASNWLDLAQEFEKEIFEFLVARDGEDPISLFLSEVAGLSRIAIEDSSSGLTIAGRLANKMTDDSKWDFQLGSEPKSVSLLKCAKGEKPGVVRCVLSGQVSPFDCRVEAQGQTLSETIELPDRYSKSQIRGQKYLAERAFQTWGRLLRAISSTSEN